MAAGLVNDKNKKERETECNRCSLKILDDAQHEKQEGNTQKKKERN